MSKNIDLNELWEQLDYAIRATDIDYGGMCVVGSIFGKIKGHIERIQDENETLSSANQDSLHEIRVLKNELEELRKFKKKAIDVDRSQVEQIGTLQGSIKEYKRSLVEIESIAHNSLKFKK